MFNEYNIYLKSCVYHTITQFATEINSCRIKFSSPKSKVVGNSEEIWMEFSIENEFSHSLEMNGNEKRRNVEGKYDFFNKI